MSKDAQEVTQRVYVYIKEYIQEHTYPPTLREIGKGCYLSTASVTRHLDKLERARKISREPGRARGITLLDDDASRSGARS